MKKTLKTVCGIACAIVAMVAFMAVPEEGENMWVWVAEMVASKAVALLAGIACLAFFTRHEDAVC